MIAFGYQCLILKQSFIIHNIGKTEQHSYGRISPDFLVILKGLADYITVSKGSSYTIHFYNDEPLPLKMHPSQYGR